MVEGVYQVCGIDLANVTIVEGETGIIVIDTLPSIEGARRWRYTVKTEVLDR